MTFEYIGQLLIESCCVGATTVEVESVGLLGHNAITDGDVIKCALDSILSRDQKLHS